MKLTPELMDSLALEGLNVITAARGTTSYEYDVTGYRRVLRRNTPRGTFRTWSPPEEKSKPVSAHPECALDRKRAPCLGQGRESSMGELWDPDPRMATSSSARKPGSALSDAGGGAWRPQFDGAPTLAGNFESTIALQRGPIGSRGLLHILSKSPGQLRARRSLHAV
jgi:hypothetical protein